MKNNGTNNGAGDTRARRLLLCLDGVPLEVVEAAKERGLFDNFEAPSRLLSPFPTMTNIALSTMLNAALRSAMKASTLIATRARCAAASAST